MADPDAGSPKFQLQPFTAPGVTVDPSVKQVGFPKHTGIEVKAALGRGFTTVVTGILDVHPKALVTVSVIEYVPGAPYV